jgi:ABC-type nitrate/sulfonate/bicarbonate transport system substrate-binding protein
MRKIQLSLLRGVCQTPAYVAVAKGYFSDEGLDARISIAATAWLIPHMLATGQADFAIIPWTRAATQSAGDVPLVVCAGSGIEEAAIVMRRELRPSDVRRVSLPREGGMKDLTAMGLLHSLGWDSVEILRQPSGDGSIISLFGQGVDAASMVEPYATMLDLMKVGTILKRTGDVWPGAPGCSLTTPATLRAADPALVAAVVRAHVRGVRFVHEHPDETAEIASRHIGVHARFIRQALDVNRPDENAVRHAESMQKVLKLMIEVGYLRAMPPTFVDLSFLDEVAAAARP